jgi:hypothetical protein
MPIPTPTTIATGLSSAAGSAYRVSTDELLIAESGSGGNITAVTGHAHVRTIVGSGYTAPQDIVLSSDGLHAYIADEPGTLYRVALTNLNKSAATVVASGLNGVQQIALDEARGVAYVCEFTGGHIQKINLTTGAKTVVATIASPRGALVTSDGQFLYVSSDNQTITRFDFSNGTSTVVASGLASPRNLTWSDAGQGVILFPQPNPSGNVMMLNLSNTPATVTEIATGVPTAPYSVAMLSASQILIVSANVVSELDLTASLISSSGPILLGIGFVPADATHLPGGYADTSMDPSYFYQVKTCPFGGTLPLLVNWQTAHADNANFYQIYLTAPGGSPVMVTQPFTDYLWSPTLNEFEAVTTVPVNGFYPLRSAGQIWLNNWLGALLDTTGQPNGLNTIAIRLFPAQSTANEIGHATDAGRFATLMIDNTEPTATINGILQQPGNVAINTCAIVTTGAPTFTFNVTASAPQHLLAWSLSSAWGNNQSKAVASDSFANHSGSPVWQGITNIVVPPPGPTPWNATVAGDPTSTHCAHSFYLAAWDRVINGWGYVHGPATYQKFITIML